MLGRYLRNQGIILLCGGLVGPIFLVVYFALGPMAKSELTWMFWSGLLVTAADVLVALALTQNGMKAEARHQHLTRTGVLCTARITGIQDTALFVNEQQMIKVGLHIDVPGTAGFDTQITVPASPARMRVLNGHILIALVEPGTTNFEIDWNASALLAGAVPAEFTVDEDHRTYNLTGREDSLLQILNVLHVNGIPLGGTIDIRSNPVVRQQVIDIVRRSAAAGGRGTGAVTAAGVQPATADRLPAVAGTRDAARDRHGHPGRVRHEAPRDSRRSLTREIDLTVVIAAESQP